MQTGEDAPQAEPSAKAGPGSASAAPGIEEALRALGNEGRAGLKAASDAGKALRILVSADISLARSAFGRTLAFIGVAIAFGASAWLMLMGALVSWLAVDVGWSWPLAFVVPAVVSLLLTAYGAWRAVVYFEHTRMRATRRQLARLGIGELADFMPDPGSGASTKQAAENVAAATEEQPVKKGLGVDITPP